MRPLISIAVILALASIVSACDSLAVCQLRQQVVVQQQYVAPVYQPVVQHQVEAVQVQPVYAVPQYAPVYAVQQQVVQKVVVQKQVHCVQPVKVLSVGGGARFPVLAARAERRAGFFGALAARAAVTQQLRQ